MKICKLSLTPVERVIIADFFPQSGTREAQRNVRDIDEILIFSDEEHERLQIESNINPANGSVGVSFKNEPEREKATEFVFTESQIRLLKAQVEKFDKDGKIDFRRNLALADKIMDAEIVEEK